MNRRLTKVLPVLVIGLLPLVVMAQPVTQPSTQPAGQMPGMGMGGQGQGQSGQMDKMDKMAESMTAMAQMCQTMMQREDATLRRALIGACIVGVLLVIALILFIILEVQWIRFFGVRIATERRKLNSETK